MTTGDGEGAAARDSESVRREAEPPAQVLVIDDSDIARRSMTRALKAAGLVVIDLPSPIGATSAILRKSVRVVVIDVHMPSMRGDKLAALFRKSDRLAHLKIVLASGADASLLKELADEVKADAIVSKSEGNEALVRAVRKLLEES
jgi:CheY-like chemotaxis protein